MKRTDFEKRILELLVIAKLISEEQQNMVLDEQTISEAKTVGEIAVDKGIISQANLNAMLKAQEAEKIAQFGEGKNSRIPLERNGDIITGFKTDERGFRRDYIDNETDKSLLGFQVVEHLCALLSGAVQIAPSLANDAKVKQTISTLKILGGIAYLEAAQDIAPASSNISAGMTDCGNSLIDGSDMSKDECLITLHDAVSIAGKALPESQHEVFSRLVKKRENQISVAGKSGFTLNDLSEIRDLIKSTEPDPEEEQIKF